MTTGVPQYELETKKVIWDNKHGERIEVGPDGDGLDLVEIRSYDAAGKLEREISFRPDQAHLVWRALGELGYDVRKIP
jgi:hypothetical protein